MCNACPTAAVGFLSFQSELNAFKKFQSITYPVICDKNVVTPKSPIIILHQFAASVLHNCQGR
jgi:hypothetical protein